MLLDSHQSMITLSVMYTLYRVEEYDTGKGMCDHSGSLPDIIGFDPYFMPPADESSIQKGHNFAFLSLEDLKRAVRPNNSDPVAVPVSVYQVHTCRVYDEYHPIYGFGPLWNRQATFDKCNADLIDMMYVEVSWDS